MNEVFQVVKKEDHSVIRKVYDVRNDNCGYPHFLIYENGEWKYVSAKHFVPYSSIPRRERICNALGKEFGEERSEKILEELEVIGIHYYGRIPVK